MHRHSFMESSQLGNGGDGQRTAGGEKGLKLFGVILGERGRNGEEEEEAMRKSVSMGNLASFGAGGAAEGGGGDQGYLSDGGLVGGSRRRRGGGQERKRGVPWTEEEHRTFLAGLKKLGKGGWRGISRDFVPTRTPTQVASHAQKYFLRHNNPNKKKRRSSLFDVVIDETAANAEIDPKLCLMKTHEAVKETDHLCPDNHLAGTPSFNMIHSVSRGAEASQALSPTTDCNKTPNSQCVSHMVGISGSKDQTLPSLIPTFTIPEHSTLTFHSNSATFVPDFLKLSLSHPHCLTQSSATLPLTESSDLELSIAPPRSHGLDKLSSQGVAGAIRVV